MKLGILFNGFAAMVLAVPIVAISFFLGYARSRERLSLLGAARDTSATFLKARRGWLLFAIPT